MGQKEVWREIKKYIELNENESTLCQKRWDPAKAVLRRKLMAQDAYVRKEEKLLINYLNSYLKNLEKENWNKYKSSRREEIIKMQRESMKLKTEKR